MKITLQKLVASNDALAELGKLQLVAKSSLKIARILRVVQVELELFEKQRVECAKKFGTLNEAKQLYELGENAQKFSDEVREMLETEIEIVVEKLAMVDLEGVKVMPVTLAALDWMIEE